MPLIILTMLVTIILVGCTGTARTSKLYCVGLCVLNEVEYEVEAEDDVPTTKEVRRLIRDSQHSSNVHTIGF